MKGIIKLQTLTNSEVGTKVIFQSGSYTEILIVRKEGNNGEIFCNKLDGYELQSIYRKNEFKELVIEYEKRSAYSFDPSVYIQKTTLPLHPEDWQRYYKRGQLTYIRIKSESCKVEPVSSKK